MTQVRIKVERKIVRVGNAVYLETTVTKNGCVTRSRRRIA